MTNTISRDQYAVIGNPIAHSKSPIIHSYFAQATEQTLDYKTIQCETNDFTKTVDNFFNQGGCGLNVTVPFKIDAHNYAHSLSQQAKLAGAVNTLINRENTIVGDNTDGRGLVRDITLNQKVGISGQRILIIGAGGATRGVLAPLLEQAPKSIDIINRTDAKSQELSKSFSHLGEVNVKPYSEEIKESYDIIINASSAGLAGEAPPLGNNNNLHSTFCYDMVYGKTKTPFIKRAETLGCQFYCDGLGMLVEQAAESFKLWRGIYPETLPILEHLKTELI